MFSSIHKVQHPHFTPTESPTPYLHCFHQPTVPPLFFFPTLPFLSDYINLEAFVSTFFVAFPTLPSTWQPLSIIYISPGFTNCLLALAHSPSPLYTGHFPLTLSDKTKSLKLKCWLFTSLRRCCLGCWVHPTVCFMFQIPATVDSCLQCFRDHIWSWPWVLQVEFTC